MTREQCLPAPRRPLGSSCCLSLLAGGFRQTTDGFCTVHELRPKGLDHVKWRSKPETTRRIRAQFNLGSNIGLESNKSMQREPEPSQSQAGRPRRGRPAFNCRRWSYATSIDSERRSKASTQRRWPRGHIPRPAGLGEAGRPHMTASAALPWRGRQAQRTYLRATDAQPSTDFKVV